MGRGALWAKGVEEVRATPTRTPTPKVLEPWPTSLVSTACRHPSPISSLPNSLHRAMYSYSTTPATPKLQPYDWYAGDTSDTSFPDGFLTLRGFKNCILRARRDENTTHVSTGTADGFLQQY